MSGNGVLVIFRQSGGQIAEVATHFCGRCEYFDQHCGGCLNPHSDRLQATAESPACRSFYPSIA